MIFVDYLLQRVVLKCFECGCQLSFQFPPIHALTCSDTNNFREIVLVAMIESSTGG